MTGRMTVARAREILGPELVAEIDALPRVPLSPWQIARLAPILRAALDRADAADAAAAASDTAA